MNGEITGMIIKAGEGPHNDGDFLDHYGNAIDQGVDVGVYWFTRATTPEEAANEANVLVDRLSDIDDIQLSLGIWFDVEDMNMPDCTPFERSEIIMAFINVITEWNHDVMVGVYSGYYCLRDSIDMSAIPAYVKYWMAYYDDVLPDISFFPTGRILYAWQFTDGYLINGEEYDSSYVYEGD